MADIDPDILAAAERLERDIGAACVSSRVLMSLLGKGNVNPLPPPPPAEATVSDLSVTPGVGTATLAWSEVGTAANAIIYRDSVQVDTVAWGVGTWTSAALADGVYSWTVAPAAEAQSAPVVMGCMTADVYVDPTNGLDTNDGSTPALAVQTINKAGTLVTTSGMTIALRGGTYSEYNSNNGWGATYGGALETSLNVAGTAVARNYLLGFPGETPTVDGSSIDRATDMTTGLSFFSPSLLGVRANYWTIQGWSEAYPIVVQNSAGAGIGWRGYDYVHVRNVHSHTHYGTGLYGEQTSYSVVENFAVWDCASFEDYGSADGVGLTLSDNSICRDGVIMYCSDDGYDIIASNSTHGNHLVERVVVYGAGRLTNGSAAVGGNGMGFKMGGNAGSLNNTVRDCVSVNPSTDAFTANQGGGITLEHCTAIDARYGVDLNSVYGGNVAKNNIAYLYTAGPRVSGTQTYNSWNTPPGVTVTSADFKTLTFDDTIRSWSDFVASEYGQLALGSDMVGAGVVGEDLGFRLVATDPVAPSYLDDPYYDSVVAFEGAMGYGANATGGRGNGTSGSTTLYFVTNLSDSGAGSLRAALEATGKRVIVPKVSGYVPLATAINPTGEFTFLGQLAPGGGLAIKPDTLPKNLSGYLRLVGVDNVVMRYLTVRSGENLDGYASNDGIRISTATDTILDHVSVSFATDGLVDIGSESARVTMQNCLVAFPLEFAGHPEVRHGYATLTVDSTQVSWLYNLIADVRERVPELKAVSGFQWIGNTIYNYRSGSVMSIQADNVLSDGDFTRNTFKKGTWSDTGLDIRFRNRSGVYNRRLTVYLEGNDSSFIADVDDISQQGLMARVLSASPATIPDDARVVSEWITTTPTGTPAIVERTAAEAHAYVLANAGNNRVRDSLDVLAVSHTENDTGLVAMYTSVADAGGYPSIASGTYPTSNADGIPTAWRSATGQTGSWWQLTPTGRMVIEDYADDVAQGRYVP